jgi:hypothetical protein
LFRRAGSDETISARDETIFRLPRRTAETLQGYQAPVNFEAGLGDSQMHAVGLILALAFVLVAPSMAGSVQSDLPGIGTFAYCGTPIAAPTMIIAAR